MRRACSVDDEGIAERACDHLLTCGVEAEVRKGENSHDVWVHDDRQMEAAKRELERFLASPGAPEFADVEARATALREAKDVEASHRRSRTVDVRTDRYRRATELPLFTSALMALSMAIGVITQLGDQWYPYIDRLAFASCEKTGGHLLMHGIEDITGGQVWRLVTPIFIHFGALHLVFNMFWLRDLGGQIEKEYGWELLLGLVVATAVSSNLAQFWWSGPRFGGMSGVVYGLFGYIWGKSRNEPSCKIDVDDDTVKVMLIWLVLCMSGGLGPIANTAHVVGLAAGVIIGGGPGCMRRMRRRPGR